jgi:primary-amine oxidase
VSRTGVMAGSGTHARHPLDPLTADELRRAARAALASVPAPEHVRVVDVSLHEPDKAALRNRAPVAREAWVVLSDRRRASTHELVIACDDDTVVSQRELPGVQAAITPSEWNECEQAVRADSRFAQALARRGITDLDLVTIEAWGMGTHADPDHRDRRLAWTPSWVREDPEDNPYAHPVDGVYAIVDLNTMEVIEVEDHGVTPIPTASGRYRPEATGLEPRVGLRPLEIVQPEGPSFDVDGWGVAWQRWRLRVGFTAREGLVLHGISYEDGGRQRPIVYRASFTELVVPYGDPGPAGYRKSAFDIGEYGIGMLTNSLELGCDCLGHIHYFDVELCNDRGEPYTITNAICLHEEDAGLSWKHTDSPSGHVETRRMRRLVISSVVTVGNYEYGFYWYLYQDGTIESEIKATGIVLTQGAGAANADYGVIVAPGLIATHHQHFFCARFDMEIDGERNSVYEVNTETVPRGPGNPHGNAFRPVLTRLEREPTARRTVDAASARYWLIANDGIRNGLGERVAYKLVPGATAVPFFHADSDVDRRASFLRHNVWVTHYDRRERFPAGEYPNQHPGGDGLPAYQAADRSIVDDDIVLWYAFGMLHISRPEDWPVMPVERIGFMLKPAGFFDRNPALDVAPPTGHGHCCDR